MSGGHFDYKQYHIRDIAESIEEYVDGKPIEDKDDLNYLCKYAEDDDAKYMKEHMHTRPNPYEFSKQTLEEFRKGVKILKEAAVYAQRIDWLLSFDDGEETFHERLKEDLAEIRNN